MPKTKVTGLHLHIKKQLAASGAEQTASVERAYTSSSYILTLPDISG